MRTILIVEDPQEVQSLLGMALCRPGRRLLHASLPNRAWPWPAASAPS